MTEDGRDAVRNAVAQTRTSAEVSTRARGISGIPFPFFSAWVSRRPFESRTTDHGRTIALACLTGLVMRTRTLSMPAKKTNPPPRPAALAGTPSRLLEAALRAFADLGFDGATTRDIAAAAGVNQGLITYHFSGKEELWKAAVDHVFARLQAEFATALRMLAEVDARTRLRLVVRQFVRFTAAHPELHRLIEHEGKSDGPRLRWLVDRHVRPLFDATMALIREAQAEGVLPQVPAAHLHFIFLGAAAHIFVVAPEFRRLTGDDPMDPKSVEAHADALVELLFGTRA